MRGKRPALREGPLAGVHRVVCPQPIALELSLDSLVTPTAAKAGRACMATFRALTTRRDLLAGGVGSVVLTSATSSVRANQNAIVPFTYRASDDALADLRRRLELTRWPEPETEQGWEQGPPLRKLQQLVAYWRTDYAWRRCETELNQWPQFKTTIDSLGIHFIHVRSRHQNALPIILTHGWPSTVLLFRDVIAPLTDPTAHGGKA